MRSFLVAAGNMLSIVLDIVLGGRYGADGSQSTALYLTVAMALFPVRRVHLTPAEAARSLRLGARQPAAASACDDIVIVWCAPRCTPSPCYATSRVCGSQCASRPRAIPSPTARACAHVGLYAGLAGRTQGLAGRTQGLTPRARGASRRAQSVLSILCVVYLAAVTAAQYFSICSGPYEGPTRCGCAPPRV